MRWVWLLVLGACAQPYVPEPTVSVLPLLGNQTGVVDDGGLRLGFALDWRFAQVCGDCSVSAATPAQVNAVASGLQVITWPEGATVATTPVPNDTATRNRIEIAVVPTAALSTRWYAVTLATLPPDTKAGAYPTFSPPDGGTSGLFHVGSAPQLMDFALYTTKGKAVLEFSEPVERPGDGSGVVSLVHKGVSVSCHVGELPGEMPNPSVPGLEFTKVRTSWDVRCGASFDPTESLTLTIGAGFRTPGGANVRGLPYSETLVLKNAVFCGETCYRRFLFASRGPQ